MLIGQQQHTPKTEKWIARKLRKKNEKQITKWEWNFLNEIK